MVPVLEAVPNFSAGRDPTFLNRLVRAVADAGAEVLDASADPDHNRSVVTFVGSPEAVEEAAVSTARLAVESIDLRSHDGAHPRVGALDVLPFVPLQGLTMEDARTSARIVGERLAVEVGVPVYFYGEASEPAGRGLAELRRGGFPVLEDGFPEGREPDLVPPGWARAGAHPTAGVTCVGARPLLLAWNVEVRGLSEERLRQVATAIRERDGGFEGLRALGLVLGEGARLQVSMNLEDVRNRKPFAVFQEIERRVQEAGGHVVGTEIIGMIPDGLVFDSAADRLSLLDPDPSRVLSSRLARHVERRIIDEVERLSEVVAASGERTPTEVRRVVERLERVLAGPHIRNGTL